MSINNQTSLSIKKSIKTALCLTASIVGIHAQASSSNEAIWQSAYKNFESGNATACYQGMQALEYLVGDVTYDKLLGLCAQGVGKNDQALLAYNRILSQQENNAEIRLERARVLYNLNMYADSKKEFQWLLDRNPPQSAARTIKGYLSSIKRKRIKIKPYTRLRISTNLGQDDNVNSATDLNDFLGFTLNENSRATSSTYYGIGLTAERNVKLSKTSRLKFSTSLSNKSYQDAEFANQELLLSGLSYKSYLTSTDGVVSLDLLTYRQKVDSDFNSRGTLFMAAYEKNLSERTSIKPYLRAGPLRYANNIAVKDVNQYVVGTILTHIPSKSKSSLYSVDLSIGRDYPLFTDSNFETEFGAISISQRHRFSTKLSSYTQLQYKTYKYDMPFFANSFPEARNDDYISATTSINWKLSDSFSLTPKLSYRDASSNVDLFSYNRWFAEITANYQRIW